MASNLFKYSLLFFTIVVLLCCLVNCSKVSSRLSCIFVVVVVFVVCLIQTHKHAKKGNFNLINEGRKWIENWLWSHGKLFDSAESLIGNHDFQVFFILISNYAVVGAKPKLF